MQRGVSLWQGQLRRGIQQYNRRLLCIQRYDMLGHTYFYYAEHKACVTKYGFSMFYFWPGSRKKFGKWRNLGQCAFPSEFSPENKIVRYNKTCIPGRVQHQIRSCQDGTGGGDSDDQTENTNGNHKCRLEEKIRSIECEIDICKNASKNFGEDNKGNL